MNVDKTGSDLSIHGLTVEINRPSRQHTLLVASRPGQDGRRDPADRSSEPEFPEQEQVLSLLELALEQTLGQVDSTAAGRRCLDRLGHQLEECARLRDPKSRGKKMHLINFFDIGPDLGALPQLSGRYRLVDGLYGPGNPNDRTEYEGRRSGWSQSTEHRGRTREQQSTRGRA